MEEKAVPAEIQRAFRASKGPSYCQAMPEGRRADLVSRYSPENPARLSPPAGIVRGIMGRLPGKIYPLRYNMVIPNLDSYCFILEN